LFRRLEFEREEDAGAGDEAAVGGRVFGVEGGELFLDGGAIGACVEPCARVLILRDGPCFDGGRVGVFEPAVVVDDRDAVVDVGDGYSLGGWEGGGGGHEGGERGDDEAIHGAEREAAGAGMMEGMDGLSRCNPGTGMRRGGGYGVFLDAFGCKGVCLLGGRVRSGGGRARRGGWLRYWLRVMRVGAGFRLNGDAGKRSWGGGFPCA